MTKKYHRAIGAYVSTEITPLTRADASEIAAVINEAAERYAGAIPDDVYSEPYMPLPELRSEMDEISFVGVNDDGLVGVIGRQSVETVSLIRHLYVRPTSQRRGVGTHLLDHAIANASSDEILVGTWEAATWAIDFYRTYGFTLVEDTDALLRTYWDAPERQIAESVVLRYWR